MFKAYSGDEKRRFERCTIGDSGRVSSSVSSLETGSFSEWPSRHEPSSANETAAISATMKKSDSIITPGNHRMSGCQVRKSSKYGGWANILVRIFLKTNRKLLLSKIFSNSLGNNYPGFLSFIVLYSQFYKEFLNRSFCKIGEKEHVQTSHPSGEVGFPLG